MTDSPNYPRAELISYLTSAMPPDRRASFERRIVEDEAFSDAIALVEQELLEEYASNSLSAEEKVILDPWVLASPRRKEHVRLTRDLLLHVRRSGSIGSASKSTVVEMPLADGIPERSTGFKSLRYLWTIAACALFAVALAWNLHRHTTPQLPQQANVQIPPLERPAPLSPDTVLLSLERTRGTSSDATTYTLHTGAPIRLQVLLPPSNQIEGYVLQLRYEGTKTSSTYRGLSRQTGNGMQFLELTLPHDTLKSGIYTARLLSSSGQRLVRFRIVLED